MDRAVTVSSLDCCSCGACCATFRVSFYWAEAAIRGLPSDLVEQLTVCPAVLGRLSGEAFVLTRGVPQPWGLRDLSPAELWTAPSGELREIESWLTQIGVAPQAL